MQLSDNPLPFFAFVPEEEHPLLLLLVCAFGGEDGLKGVGVKPCVPHLAADGHRGGSEILNLFQAEVKSLGDDGQFRHVLSRSSRMAADEIWNQLLAKMVVAVDFVEQLLEFVEEGERRLPHQLEHLLARMLWSNF